MSRLSLIAAIALPLLVASAGLQAAIWDCDTFAEIRTAVTSANPGDTVLIQPGQYHVTSSLYCQRQDIIVRGSTGNRDDVVLYGNGMNVNSGVLEGFWTAADGIQIRDLTISGFYDHGIHVCDNPSGNLSDNVVVSNVKIQNCGERFIKGSGNGTSHNVLVENVHFLQTEPYTQTGGPDPNYIGGIDAMHTDNWIIRDCRFEGIMGAGGGARGAIFLWQGCTNVLIERNVIVNCAEGIDLGNGYNPNNVYHAEDAIVRNNFIGWGGGDNRAVQLGFTRNVQFVNNTIYTEDNYNRTVHVYDSAAVPSSNVLLENNLIRGEILDTSTGGATLVNNITGATPQGDWFVDALASDLHLTVLATPAIDHALPLTDVPEDFDRQGRPCGCAPDIGADEFVPEPAMTVLLAVGGLVTIRRRRAL